MTNEELILRSVGEIVERLVARFSAQASDHETKMAEHRAAFGARTEADRKIIAGLREESAKCQAELDDLYQREGIEKKRRMDVEDERDALRAEVAALKSQNPKQHPVKVGEWVKRLTPSPMTPAGGVAKVTDVFGVHGLAVNLSQLEYEVVRPNGQKGRWSAKGCEPCDPPATHDTEAGKAAAESGLLLNGGLDVRKVTT